MTVDANEVEVVYTTNDIYEAEIIRNQLHDAGIKCELDGDSQGGFTEIVETKLLVRAGDAGRARKLIERRTTENVEPPRDGGHEKSRRLLFLEEPQMDQSNVKSLLGMKIIGQHGREIGVITDMCADVETWQLHSLEVKLNRETLDDLKLKRTWFGTQTVRVPVTEISGATDNLVLKSTLEEMDFSGGQPAAAALPVEKGESEGTGTPDERSESTT